MRFTQFYVPAVLPDGATLPPVYAHQAGIGWMMSNQNLPGFGDLGKNVRTIAVMKTAGYATYMSESTSRRM